jgi:predicted RNase H-like nuclease (RuvC/YqgF family)
MDSNLQQLNVKITKEGSWFKTECVDLGIVCQGLTIGEALDKLKETSMKHQERVD